MTKERSGHGVGACFLTFQCVMEQAPGLGDPRSHLARGRAQNSSTKVHCYVIGYLQMSRNKR